VLPNILPLDATPPQTQLPDDLARAPTLFMRRDGNEPPLQPLYDGPYAVIRRSLHHFTLRIGDKEDKVSTLRLKPGTDPTSPPAQPRVRGPPPAAVHFRKFFPRQGPQQPAGYTSSHSNQKNPFSPGPLPGVFACPAAVLDHAGARPARNRRAPSSLDL
jgi:hypothetical protein